MLGTVFKRCGCTEPTVRRDGTPTTRQLGQRCPKLHRTDGTWNPRHGTWAFQLQVPDTGGPQREHLRQSGLAGEEDAKETVKAIEALLEVASLADDPPATRRALAAVIRQALAARTALPDPAEVRRQIGLSIPVDAHAYLAEDMHTWLALKSKTRRRNTVRSYQQQFTDVWIPKLGHIRRDRLNAGHVQAVLDEIGEQAVLIAEQNAQRHAVLAESKAAWCEHRSLDARRARALLKEMPPFRRPRGTATIQRYRAGLRSFLTYMVKKQLISDNVAKHVELLSARRPKARMWTAARVEQWQETGQIPFPVMVWTAEQTAIFLRAARSHPFYAAFVVVAVTGLRRGEVCALRWVEIDFTTGQIEIIQQLLQYGWEADLQEETKSLAGDRVVVGTPQVLKALARCRKQQLAQKEAKGQHWIETGLVFTTETGTPIHPSALTDALRQIAASVGLPPIRLHDLRHGTATMALRAGIEMKIVSEMLGHSSTTITADTYTSVADELKRQAAERIADQLALDDEDEEIDQYDDAYRGHLDEEDGDARRAAPAA
jgi:integrase